MDSEPRPRPAVPPTPPATATTGAVAPIGEMIERPTEERAVPAGRVLSWAMWDWATQPFNSVLLTFVFTALYLVSDAFLSPELAALPDGDPLKEAAVAELSSGFGLAMTIAGVAILLLAPVLGRASDRSGRKKLWLGVSTTILALLQFALFFVFADPAFFWYGAVVLAVGTVVNEIAGVNYNAMLVEVSTPRTIGRVSGLGWGLGYIGGIVALVIVVALTLVDWFGMDTSDGLTYRLIAVGCGVWTILFAIPLFVGVPEAPARPGAERVGPLSSYIALGRDVVELFRSHRPTFWFLLASAVYRDGLAGVFAFGGVLASTAFGLAPTEVIVFAIAANLVAGLSTILAGPLDDRFGPRAVIIATLATLVAVAVGLFAFHGSGQAVFWACGLVLSACVGPAQAASRSLLARVTPDGMQGEIFGLYATTGRAASFLAPAMWTLFIIVFGATIWGVLGLGAVLLVGLVLFLLVRLPPHQRVR